MSSSCWPGTPRPPSPRWPRRPATQARLFAQGTDVLEAYRTAHSGDIQDEGSPQSQAGRERIRAALKPHLKGVTDGGGSKPKFHFLLPNGRSLSRVWRDGWQTLRNGKEVDVSDDVSGFRSMVRNLPRNPDQDIEGIELGRVGLAIRGMTAIRDTDGTLLGMVENIRGFGQVFDRLAASNVSVAVYLNVEGLDIAKKLKTQPDKYPILDGEFCVTQSSQLADLPAPTDVAFLRKGRSGLVVEIEGATARAAWPVLDVQGREVAVIGVRRSIAGGDPTGRIDRRGCDGCRPRDQHRPVDRADRAADGGARLPGADLRSGGVPSHQATRGADARGRRGRW